MANHYRVSPKFWPWARRHRLTDAQTDLALYLLTCEHRNLEGIYRLPKPYIAADLGWPARKVDESLAAVIATGFAMYDEDAEVVLIPKALKHQAPSTEKQIAGAIAQIDRIPRTSLWDEFRIACRSHCPKLADEIDKRWPSDPDLTSHAHATAPAGAHAGPSSSSSSISSSTSKPQKSVGNEQANETVEHVQAVVEILSQCQHLHIDAIGVENAIAAWPNGDAVQAAREVVTWATDPAFQMTNGARALNTALSKQQQRQQQTARTQFKRPGAQTGTSAEDFMAIAREGA